MNRVQLMLGCCLVFGAALACSSEGGEDEPNPTGGSSGAAGANGTDAGSGGSSAGATTAGQGGSAGSSSASGQGGTAGTAGGSGGAAGSAGTAGTGGGGDDINCIETDRGCLCSPLPPQPEAVALCTAQSVNGMCCEDTTGFCSCRQWSCENDAFGCSCGSNTDGPLTACTGVYGVCCLSVIGTASNCYCDDTLTECVGENDMEVANCEIDIAPCAAGETEVDACKP